MCVSLTKKEKKTISLVLRQTLNVSDARSEYANVHALILSEQTGPKVYITIDKQKKN